MVPITVVIVEDNQIITDTLRDKFMLETSDIRLVGSASRGREGIKEILAKRPMVGLIDIMLPDSGMLAPDNINGVAVIREVRKVWPEAKLLVYTAETLHYRTKLVLQKAMIEGAVGIVFKSFTVAQLIEVIRQVVAGQIHLSSEMATELFGDRWKNKDILNEISPRRKKIGAYMTLGYTRQQILKALQLQGMTSINDGQIRDELSALYRQLDVPNGRVATSVIDQLIMLGEWEKPIPLEELEKKGTNQA